MCRSRWRLFFCHGGDIQCKDECNKLPARFAALPSWDKTKVVVSHIHESRRHPRTLCYSKPETSDTERDPCFRVDWDINAVGRWGDCCCDVMTNRLTINWRLIKDHLSFKFTSCLCEYKHLLVLVQPAAENIFIQKESQTEDEPEVRVWGRFWLLMIWWIHFDAKSCLLIKIMLGVVVKCIWLQLVTA